jgi:putative endopeptidase
MKKLIPILALAVVAAAPAQGPGIDLAGMDRSVAPGDDFYAYGNGAWMKTAVIPPDKSRWGTIGENRDKSDTQVADLVKAAAKAQPGTEARKVGDFFTADMDEARIESLGLKPLKPDLDRIAALKDKAGLAAELGSELRADVDPLNATNLHTNHLFGLWVEQDLNDPSRYAPYLLQGGLGMPDRDYYVSDKPASVAIRKTYQAHLAKLAALASLPDAAGIAQRAFDLETKIARVHATRGDSEDVLKANNSWTQASFSQKAPGLDWPAFFTAASLQGQTRFVVWHPRAVTGEAALVASEPLTAWKDYLTIRHLDTYSNDLPKSFVAERFDFYSHTLSGQPQIAARWQRSVAEVNNQMGEAVGKLYTAKYFPPSTKAAVQAMVTDIKAAFGQRIDNLEWMAPATKAEAKKKLVTLKVGVGYPDHWKSYAGLVVSPTDALGNLRRAELFNYRQEIAKLGRPVDRGEWAMTPQTVNAVNLPVKNALNFPAAYLAPPDFNPANPKALNYGAIGVTIGHEISHSFDDQGAQFDSTGRLRDWWTPQDLAHFRAQARALAAQFSAYKPFPDLNLNGEQELSENIADLGGLNVAFDAYRAAYGGKPGPAAQGLTGDQQFFLAYSQSQRTKTREAALRQQVVTDGHAPGEYRADTARNLDAWYAAFDVKPGQKLYLAPDKRVKVW